MRPNTSGLSARLYLAVAVIHVCLRIGNDHSSLMLYFCRGGTQLSISDAGNTNWPNGLSGKSSRVPGCYCMAQPERIRSERHRPSETLQLCTPQPWRHGSKEAHGGRCPNPPFQGVWIAGGRRATSVKGSGETFARRTRSYSNPKNAKVN